MRKLLSAVAAIVFSGALAMAASFTPVTGPQDPSQLNASLNALLTNINAGVNGIIANLSTTVASTATTVEQNLASVSIPASTLTKSGQSVKARCSGLLAANTHTSTIKLYYGTSSVSTAATPGTGNPYFNLELLVAYDASATAGKYVGTGQIGSTMVAVVATSNTTDNMASALTAKCTTTQGTASASDTLLMNFLVEQVK